MVLCLCIIPLSFYVSVKNYAQRVSDYQQEVQTYQQQSEGQISAHFNAEGIHPPSPLSIFSQGLGNSMPYKVVTTRGESYKIEYVQPDYKQDLMGKIDFAYIVVMVLSILALVFTFNAISGDKENGIFRAILSNPVLRRQILLSKLIGNYIVFSIPFLISIFVALLIVYASGIVPIFSAQLFPSVLAMIGISMLFLFALFNLGLWMSAFTRSSTLSINVLLLIWIVISLVIPKVSPIISEVIYPVESSNVFEAKRKAIKENFTREMEAEESKVGDEIDKKYHALDQINNWEAKQEEFDEQVTPIREKYGQLIVSEIGKITTDYNLRRDKQNRISKTISNLSIINSANKLLAEFSATGVAEAENFIKQAKQFHETVEQSIYNNYNIKTYRTTRTTNNSYIKKEGFDPSKVQTPTMDNYKHVSLSETFQQNWSDIMLLGFYCLLFFVAAFVCFIRFDVR
jgi:ABC-type transport system involved in multi-copper enzyme maturation permease subunit